MTSSGLSTANLFGQSEWIEMGRQCHMTSSGLSTANSCAGRPVEVCLVSSPTVSPPLSRLSVKRMRQEDKDVLTKQSMKSEALMRRASLAQQVNLHSTFYLHFLS